MASQVADPEMAAAINTIAAGLVGLRKAGVTPANARDAITCTRELEALRRSIDAACVDLMTEIDDQRFHLADGHASAKAMVRHHARLSNGEALARQRTGKMFRTLPEVGNAYRRGAVGADHVRAIAAVHSNSRVRSAMPAKQRAFLQEAKASFDDFDQRLQQWKRLTDEDAPKPTQSRGPKRSNRSGLRPRVSCRGIVCLPTRAAAL